MPVSNAAYFVSRATRARINAMKKRVGKKEIGAVPDVHELITADFLAGLGYDLVFIAPKRTPGVRTPDICMVGALWEMKSPKENNLLAEVWFWLTGHEPRE